MTRTVAFVLHQPQDYVLSAGYARLLRRRTESRGLRPPALVGLVLGDAVDPGVAHYTEELGETYVLGSVRFPPPRPRPAVWTLARIRAMRRAARRLPLRRGDVLAAYSFRELPTNVLLRALPERPTLVRIRKCDHASEATLVRRRPLVSLHFNIWNTLFGISRLRYRWLPTTDRSWAGVFVRDPYDVEFCVGPPGSDPHGGRWVPYPFAALLPPRQGAAGRPEIVVLGELYPLDRSLPLERFVPEMNDVLRHVRAAFPGHRLVFKPRTSVAGMGFDLTGYDVAYEDVLLEDLLLQEPAVEKVISVKSSGSALATLYGKEGYLLYPLFDFPADFRANLDAYFAAYTGSVRFVERLAEIGTAPARPPSLEELEEQAAPLLDLLAGGQAALTVSL